MTHAEAIVDKNTLVGMTIPAARELLDEQGLRLRVSKLDGESQIVTCDLRSDRINVEVESNEIISVIDVG